MCSSDLDPQARRPRTRLAGTRMRGRHVQSRPASATFGMIRPSNLNRDQRLTTSTAWVASPWRATVGRSTGDRVNGYPVRRSWSMVEFQPSEAFQLPLQKNRRKIDRSTLKEFWQHVEEANSVLPNARGCYIFGIRARTAMPWYVGETRKNASGLKAESLSDRNVKIYDRILGEHGHGTPVLIFVWLAPGKGAPPVKAIHELEEALIAYAYDRNPELENIRRLPREKSWCIQGVVPPSVGKPSEAARGLRSVLGLH